MSTLLLFQEATTFASYNVLLLRDTDRYNWGANVFTMHLSNYKIPIYLVLLSRPSLFTKVLKKFSSVFAMSQFSCRGC